MNTRIIGIDLAVTAVHKAIVLDQAKNEYVSKVIRFHTDPAEMDELIAIARQNTPEDTRLVGVLEATGMSWFPVSTYLSRKGVEMYRVNGQKTAALRRVFKRHAKSDKIDTQVLAKLYLSMPEYLHQLRLPSGAHMALQRACRERHRLTKQMAAIKNRLQARDRMAWLGFPKRLPPYATDARWVRNHWYNPWQVMEVGAAGLTQHWCADHPEPADPPSWIPALVEKAQKVIDLYGDPQCVNYDLLQDSLSREQSRLALLEEQEKHLRLKVIRPLYRQLYPSRHLETIRGIGQESAAVYIAFIHDILRFPTISQFRSWSGMIPFSNQSGLAQAQGLHITQAGPNLIKATAFQDANVARLWDPQIAAIYYHQMMHKGKHHLQAVCACATHLLNRVYAILREDRPYQLRDLDGNPISKQQGHTICTSEFPVPEAVRIQRNHKSRKARKDQKLENRLNRKQAQVR